MHAEVSYFDAVTLMYRIRDIFWNTILSLSCNTLLFQLQSKISVKE